jgi:drug/metabolite transporter (DMT)-like permease
VLGTYVGLAVSLVVWGTLQPMAKGALGGLEPTQFTFLRAFAAGVALLLVCVATGRLRRLREELTPLWMPVLLGVLAFTLSNHFSMAALVFVSAGTNSVLTSTTPLLVAAGAPLLGKHAGLPGTLGAVLGFAGILVSSLGSDGVAVAQRARLGEHMRGRRIRRTNGALLCGA